MKEHERRKSWEIISKHIRLFTENLWQLRIKDTEN